MEILGFFPLWKAKKKCTVTQHSHNVVKCIDKMRTLVGRQREIFRNQEIFPLKQIGSKLNNRHNIPSLSYQSLASTTAKSSNKTLHERHFIFVFSFVLTSTKGTKFQIKISPDTLVDVLLPRYLLID